MTAQLALDLPAVQPHGIDPDWLTTTNHHDLAQALGALSQVRGVLEWATGDALVEAMRRIGTGDAPAFLVDALDGCQAAHARAVTVAVAYGPHERRGGLSWAHHEAVAARPDRDHLLDLAEADGLSVTGLREVLRRLRAQEDRDRQLGGGHGLPQRPPGWWKPQLGSKLAVFWADNPDAAVVLRPDGTWGPLIEEAG